MPTPKSFAFSRLPRFLARSEISSLLFARTQRRLPHLLAPLNWAGLEPNRVSKLLATSLSMAY